MNYNPFSPVVHNNPYPYYAYLRQQAPVYLIPELGFWAVSRYEDVLFVLKNPNKFSSERIYAATTEHLNFYPPEAPAMVGIDPPDHTRLRKLVNRAFTPRRVASLERRVREAVQDLLEPMACRGEGDLMHDFAIPFPSVVIGEMLGVPVERRADFHRWGANLIRSFSGTHVPQEEQAEIRQSHADLRAYLEELIAVYRHHPGDNLLSALVEAEEEGQRLTAAEIVSLAAILIVGGNETTANLIGNALLSLFAHPQEFARVRANLDLVPQLVEEALRYESPVQSFVRHTTCEVELAGTRIPAGAAVMPLFGSANRDERKFPAPERFDITRNAEGHLGFGHGIHFCLGAQLARLEAQTALEMLLRRFPRLARKDRQVTWIDSVFTRGPEMLSLVYAA
jgi:hypothetical protein